LLIAVKFVGEEGVAMRFKRAGFLTKIVILILLVYMATSLLDLRSKIQTVQMQRDDLSRQVVDQRLANQQLADAIEHSDDPEMLEQVARDKGYVKQGEEIFIDVSN
jgi:cell division protein FtsB